MAERENARRVEELAKAAGAGERSEKNATRRDLFKAAGAVVAGGLAPLRAQTAPAPPAAFFTPEEFALLDELTELILPADEHSPGARAAQVAAYIDQQVHEAVEDELKSEWRDGLKRIDALSSEMHSAAFLEASPAQRVAVLERIARNETEPKSAEEHFFKELKARTVFAYYTSKIGIHIEMEYKGNVYQEEFAGFRVEPLDRE